MSHAILKIRKVDSYRTVATLVLAVASLALPEAAQAQPDPSGLTLPSGSFIVLRDVPTRSAEIPAPAAAPDYVVMGGRAELEQALTLGLKPISDSEQASILADTSPTIQEFGAKLGQGVDLMADGGGAHSISLMQEHSGGAGDTVRQALGALPTALGTMRDALGSGK